MKKLIKVILPPFVGFALYFLAIRYSPEYFSLSIGEIGQGDLVAFMAYYRYALPLLFVIAVLTQLLIVKPIWDRVKIKPTAAKIRTTIIVIFICLVFAWLISYPISDPALGKMHFYKLFGFFTVVQLLYWLINVFILYLVDRAPKPKVENEV
jgi:hypothetical protein